MRTQRYGIAALFMASLLGPGLASGSILPPPPGTPAIAAGGEHTLGLSASGGLFSWGGNYHGELGDGTTTDHYLAQFQSVLKNIRAISAGTGFSLAVKSDGTVLAWGWNSFGQLGDNTTTDHYAPVQVRGPGGVGALTNVVAVAAGLQFSLALKSDGTVWALGRNDYGQLGDGTNTDRHFPVQTQVFLCSGWFCGLTPLSGAVAIAAGEEHALALKANSTTVWAWGRNLRGQLGDNSTVNRNAAVSVLWPSSPGIFSTTVVGIASGAYHSLALKADGTVWAWGANGGELTCSYGQLGDNTMIDQHVPVQTKGPGGIGALSNVAAIAAGGCHSLALKTDGTVWAWGFNGFGQLGDATQIDRAAPVQVLGYASGVLKNIRAISAQHDSSIALDWDGRVWGWGNDHWGQLGDNNPTQSRSTPVYTLQESLGILDLVP